MLFKLVVLVVVVAFRIIINAKYRKFRILKTF
jgi:hypothetical protein